MKAIYSQRRPKAFDGKWSYETVEYEVRVMARAEGWAMVRRKGCMPFVASEKELRAVGKTASEVTK